MTPQTLSKSTNQNQPPAQQAFKFLTFCLENLTQRTILFGLKGLHVAWQSEDPIVSHRFKDKVKLHNRLQKNKMNDVYMPYSDHGKRRYLCAGNGSWENLCRFELEPGGHVMGKFASHRFSDEFILVMEYVLDDDEMPSNQDFMPTQTSIGGTLDGPLSPIKVVNKHNLNVSVNDMTPLVEQTPKEEMEICVDPPQPTHKSICRSYRIRHNHKYDVILGINETRSMYPFSSAKRYSLDPFTYRIFGYHDVANSGIQIDLSQNIPKKQVISIVHDLMKKERPSQKKKKKQQKRKPKMMTSPEVSLCMCDDDFLDTHRENILFYLNLLRQAKEKITAVVIKDREDTGGESPSLEVPFDPVDYLMKNVIRASSKKKLDSWFRSHISTTTIIQDQMQKMYLKPYFHCRSIQVMEYSDDDGSGPTKRKEHVDCVIVVKSIRSRLNNRLKMQLRQLEGLPVLFMLYDLDKCHDIYEALKKKEKAELEILRIFSSSHKPFIVSCSQKRTEMDNFVVCKFIRESLDLIMERIMASTDTANVQKMLSKVISQQEAKNGDSPSKQHHWKGKDVYFFGVDNEHQSVHTAIRTFQFPSIEPIPCIHSRERFQAAKTFFQGNNDRSKFAQRLSSLSRGMTSFLNLSESSDDDEEPPIICKDTLRRVKSQGEVRLLSRKRYQFSEKSMLTELADENALPENSQQFQGSTLTQNRMTNFLDPNQRDNSLLANSNSISSTKDRSSRGTYVLDQSQIHDYPPGLIPSHLGARKLSIHNRTKSAENPPIHPDLFTNDSFTEFHKEFEKKIMENATSPKLCEVLESPPPVPILMPAEQDGLPPSSSMLAQQNEDLQVQSQSLNQTSVVVLCVELSGRLLITGENGCFVPLMEEICKRTPFTVLFVDRLDCPSEGDAKCSVNKTKEGLVFGDSKDLSLDKELQQNQRINKYFRYRCYYHLKQDQNQAELQNFWRAVLQDREKALLQKDG